MRALVAAICLACAFGAAAATESSGPPTPADPEQQVLVLLNLPPPHFRPDSDYASGYSGAGRPTRRRVAAALARGDGLILATDWPMPILGVDCT